MVIYRACSQLPRWRRLSAPYRGFCSRAFQRRGKEKRLYKFDPSLAGPFEHTYSSERITWHKEATLSSGSMCAVCKAECET
jgi:hypothetical protein